MHEQACGMTVAPIIPTCNGGAFFCQDRLNRMKQYEAVIRVCDKNFVYICQPITPTKMINEYSKILNLLVVKRI